MGNNLLIEDEAKKQRVAAARAAQEDLLRNVASHMDAPALTEPAAWHSEKPRPKLRSISAKDLLKLYIPPMEWILEGVLPHGVGVFGAPSKYFKSYLVIGACLAICSGQDYLGYKSNKCECLYFDLESTYRRPQSRIRQVLGSRPCPDGFHIVTGSATESGERLLLGKGFEDQLSEMLEENRNIKLVVIDVLEKVRASRSRNRDQYEEDYNVISTFKAISDKYDVSILLITHTTKLKREDPFDDITGSAGLLGAVDFAWTITKENRAATDGDFHVTGRDLETQQLKVSFNKSTFVWERIGSPEEVALIQLRSDFEQSSVVKTVLALLKDQEEWTGSATDIKNASYFIGTPIGIDIRMIGAELSRFRYLFGYEGITFTKDKKTKSNVYKFMKE